MPSPGCNPPATGMCLPTWSLSKPTRGGGVLIEVLLHRHDPVPHWPLVIELRLRDPLASLEILLEGGPKIAKALITWLGLPAASPLLKLGGAQAVSHLISIRKPVKVASPRRNFLGTVAEMEYLLFLLFHFILFSFILQ